MRKPSQGVPDGIHPPNPDVDAGVKLEGPLESIDTALGQILEVQSSPELERKVLLKLDLVYVSSVLRPGSGMANKASLMPMMCFAYFLQFLDKMVLSQTTLFGLREDLVALAPIYLDIYY